MRAHEFIAEARDGKIDKNHAKANVGTYRARDIGGYDRVYHMNRLWMAMAMADGKSQDAVDMDAASFAEKYNTIHPYTEEEYNMFMSAKKTVPTDSKEIVPYSKSEEPDDTNKKSLTVAFKGFKK
jgi:3-dehydroquinate dehydratase